MTSGDLIRQARMLAGLSQRGLGDRIERPFTQVARWERGETEPGLATLRWVLQACGYDINLDLVPFHRDEQTESALREHLEQTPSERLERDAEQRAFDPYALIGALERQRVSYVIIGDLAAVIRGSTALTDRLEIVPAIRPDALSALARALDELGATGINASRIVSTTDAAAVCDAGTIRILATPPGTRGYRDVRRAATREPLGKGLRPHVSPTSDLVRMAQADPARGARLLRELRRIAELD